MPYLYLKMTLLNGFVLDYTVVKLSRFLFNQTLGFELQNPNNKSFDGSIAINSSWVLNCIKTFILRHFWRHHTSFTFSHKQVHGEIGNCRFLTLICRLPKDTMNVTNVDGDQDTISLCCKYSQSWKFLITHIVYIQTLLVLLN